MHSNHNSRPLVIAHRGASALAPENTLAAFRLAVALGADGVELDVRLSVDGRPVVIHDARVDRTTDGAGSVASLTCEQLSRLDAGAWFDRRLVIMPRVQAALQRLSVNHISTEYAGENVPTLEATLSFLSAARLKRIYVEVKGTSATRMALLEATGDLIRRFRMESAVTLLSFDHELLRLAKSSCPEIRTAPIFSVAGNAILNLRAINRGTANASPDEVALHYSLATRRVIEQLHDRDIKVSVWTANSKLLMRRLVRCGVDAIITNYPDRLIAILGSQCATGRQTMRG